ncbi:hypothetical protein HMPREF9163_01500 [Selenomonas sp. oral taxon 138 str. F0429]|nr:hypothetical protein HMPREF9163_01500 [Selenomonas sp. oral taxon 138 str. F0429]
MADFMILAVDTAQRAVGEEYRARAMRADEAGFFPCVQHRTRNAYSCPRAAEAARARIPIHPAAARAERTVLEQIVHQTPPFFHIFPQKNRNGKTVPVFVTIL